MQRVWLPLVLTAILTHTLGTAQQSGGFANTLKFEDGKIENGSYSNECLGFSLPIPAGWEISAQITGVKGRATHIPSGGLALLMLDRQTNEGTFHRVVVTANDATGLPPIAQEYVSSSAHAQVNIDPERRQLVRDAFPIVYGGKQFFRADYKQSLSNGSELYVAFVDTMFRQYYLGSTIMADSQEELNQYAELLRNISFRDDQVDPRCTLDKNDPPLGVVVAGIISSKPTLAPDNATHPITVRVSQKVSSGLPIKRVQPEYPEKARRERIQGSVVLMARIDANGNVEDLAVASGDPALAPAALEAVKQWKYKPYLLDGQPVKVETQVVVSFELRLN